MFIWLVATDLPGSAECLVSIAASSRMGGLEREALAVIAVCLKDLSLIEELMTETGTRNELTRATHERFKEAGRRYGMGAGEMTVCKVIEDNAGIDLRVAGDWTAPWEVKAP